MNTRRKKSFVISVMTDDAKDQSVYIVREYHAEKAEEKAEKLYLKGMDKDDVADYMVQTVYKSRSIRDADIFLEGYVTGSQAQLGY